VPNHYFWKTFWLITGGRYRKVSKSNKNWQSPQTMFISLQGAEWHGTKLHTGLMCAGVNCFYLLCSPFRSSWRPGHPSYQTTSRELSIQRRRSCGVKQFAAGHSYCINTLFFQKSAQDSSIFSFISIIYLTARGVCCTAPL